MQNMPFIELIKVFSRYHVDLCIPFGVQRHQRLKCSFLLPADIRKVFENDFHR